MTVLVLDPSARPHNPPAPALARRDLSGLTAQAEKRLLVAIAKRLPPFVTPDQLTALGAAAMVGALACYRISGVIPLALLGVNVCLFFNWLGDSLDGTLARVRERQRPRYGFYLDHLVDGFGATFLCAGLGVSTYVQPALAAGLLVAYLLVQIHIALKAHTTGIFTMSFGAIGGTELRILLALLNVAAWLWPAGNVLNAAVAMSIPGLVTVLIADAWKTAGALDREERARWRVTDPLSRSSTDLC